MRVAGITRDSYVNGPGRRNVLHVQGCTIGCPGCFNKHTWPESGGEEITPQDVACELVKGDPDGITISGGEPMEQWDDVSTVIEEFLRRKLAGSVIIFTGWTKSKIAKSGRLAEMSRPFYMNTTLVSMVIAGPFMEKLACNKPMISSSNQEIIYIDPAYEQEKLSELPRVEVHCEGGSIKISGLPDSDTLMALKIRR